MRFIQSTFLAVAALVGLVMAGENPIIYPDASSHIVAGSSFTITWTPTTGGTVTFTLRQGPSGNLHDVSVIVSGAPNTGSYEWTPSSTLPQGTDYAIMITDDKGDVNYTPLISIDSNVAPVQSSSTVMSSSTSSSSTSSSSSTGSSTSSTKRSSTHTTEASSTITSSASSSVSSSSSIAQVYPNTTMITSYSNATATGNLTLSSSMPSSNPTSSSSSSSSHSTTASAISTGAASGLLKSPLALVVCVLGAVLYLN